MDRCGVRKIVRSCGGSATTRAHQAAMTNWLDGGPRQRPITSWQGWCQNPSVGRVLDGFRSLVGRRCRIKTAESTTCPPEVRRDPEHPAQCDSGAKCEIDHNIRNPYAADGRRIQVARLRSMVGPQLTETTQRPHFERSGINLAFGGRRISMAIGRPGVGAANRLRSVRVQGWTIDLGEDIDRAPSRAHG